MPKELTPTFTVISKACDGDETAISKILEFYDPFINQCCMCTHMKNWQEMRIML